MHTDYAMQSRRYMTAIWLLYDCYMTSMLPYADADSVWRIQVLLNESLSIETDWGVLFMYIKVLFIKTGSSRGRCVIN